VQAYRGPSLLSTAVKYLPHPATPLLDNIRSEGVPVTMSGDEWSAEKIQEMARRGPHKSAKDHALFIRDEMASFAEQGFWVVLPLPEVEDMDHLRLSPLGVVPQRDRRPRLINDLTFSGINTETVRTGPADAMQFGHTLLRLLYQIRHANPAFSPVYAMKIDVADGFYRVNLDARQALSLACHLENCRPHVFAQARSRIVRTCVCRVHATRGRGHHRCRGHRHDRHGDRHRDRVRRGFPGLFRRRHRGCRRHQDFLGADSLAACR
jgi:hypothetical protein